MKESLHKRVVSLIKKELKYNMFYPLKYIYMKDISNNEYNQYKNKKKVFIMQTPTHNNLGDHAIAYAEIQFQKKYLKDYIYIEIPFEDVFKKAKYIKDSIKKDDFIFIIGGGNMGDMYSYEEYVRRFIITYFKDFNVISFPQTISFEDDMIGKWQLNKSIKAYSKNSNLLIIAREEKSYKKMKEFYKNNNVMLTPDIVLSLDKRINCVRKGVVTCLRNDMECAMNETFKKRLLEKLKSKYKDMIITDTITKYDISVEEREEELHNIWNRFSRAEVVITDRLHGMIFCAITSTPCIVFGNSNHKIEQSYKNWLSDLKYIRFLKDNDVDAIMNEVDELIKLSHGKLMFNNCEEKYKQLVEYIKGK